MHEDLEYVKLSVSREMVFNCTEWWFCILKICSISFAHILFAKIRNLVRITVLYLYFEERDWSCNELISKDNRAEEIRENDREAATVRW